jgi:hypothetical protein
VANFNPGNRVLPPEARIASGADDLVVECIFDSSADGFRLGGLIERDQEFCFATITVANMDLSTCASVPTEVGMEVILEGDLTGGIL